MKIRNGFVSNSSSSSFCIYGTYIEFDDLMEKIKEMNFLSEEEIETVEEDNWELESILSDKTDLSVYSGDGDVWIGKEWSSIGDDETGRQFKESVKSELEKFLGPDVECETHVEEISN